MNIFGKKIPAPIEKEPQIKRSLTRGPKGRFISKAFNSSAVISKNKLKAMKKVKIQIPAAPVSVTFFGREIKKVYHEKKWYFAVEDVLALASPPSGKEKVRRKKTLNNVQKKITKKIDNVVYADADGCIKLIREVEGEFPGPLSRWLAESSQLPYEAAPKIKKAAPTGETPTSNPSDRGM